MLAAWGGSLFFCLLPIASLLLISCAIKYCEISQTKLLSLSFCYTLLNKWSSFEWANFCCKNTLGFSIDEQTNYRVRLYLGKLSVVSSVSAPKIWNRKNANISTKLHFYYVVAIRTNCTVCQLMKTISHSWDTDGVYHPLMQSVEYKSTLYLFWGGEVKPEPNITVSTCPSNMS